MSSRGAVVLALLCVICPWLRAQTSSLHIPNPLKDFLRGNPSYRLLERQDTTDVEADEGLQGIVVDEWTGDAWGDVAAVVVNRRNPKMRGIVAFHGSRTGFSSRIWVATPRETELQGVLASDGRVYSLECIHCDSNWFSRWNGRAYEVKLFAPGDTPGVVEYVDGPTLAVLPVWVRAKPSAAAERIAQVPECASARILDVLPVTINRTRWYRVEVEVSARVVVGYLPASSLTEVGCIG